MADWVGYPPSVASQRKAVLATNRLAARQAKVHMDDGQSREERNRQKEIQDVMMAAEDAEPILAVVRDVDGAIAVSTALHRLGKVGIPHVTLNDERFSLLMQKFEERLPFCGSRQMSNSLHGLGRLQYRQFGSWVEKLCIQAQRRIREFEPQHVSNSLWACARMQLQDKLLLRTLLGRAVEDIGRMCAVDVSIITWAIATLKYRDQEWLRTIVRSRLDFADFSPQNMSNFVWGLATLGFRSDNMVLAVGREAAKKLKDFIPQELSNYCWALATMDLCDNLMLRAVSEEVERRADQLHTWDPQSLSNMMWAYATLAIKDDVLFNLLLDASVSRIADHDTQNLANSSWAAAMVVYRKSAFLKAVAEAASRKIGEAPGLHLAQLAFAFSRFCFPADFVGFMPALLRETLHRIEDFAPQSLVDVQDALALFGVMPSAPNRIERTIGLFYEDILQTMERFARLHANGQSPSSAQTTAYQRDIERRDIVSLGFNYSQAFLKHFGLLCDDSDPFVRRGRDQIKSFRAMEAERDPTSRSIFHRAQCAWALRATDSQSSDLADGVFESGAPPVGQGPDAHGLTVCRLRHPREGDAEVQALCAALSTSVFRGKSNRLSGFKLNLHLSEVPCISCLGCTLQFQHRFPGVLQVSFDRGRQTSEETTPLCRPALPLGAYAQASSASYDQGPQNGTDGGVDRCMMRKNGPDLREVTSFYSAGGRPRRQGDGAGLGGMESVPHKLINKGSAKSSSQQTYYFSAQPEFLGGSDYKSYETGDK